MADPRDRASALADPPANADLGESTQKKIAWRLLPLFGLGYGVALMDRNNIGFAALQMNRDLHFSASIYGFGAGLFSIGYALFEIPSNLVLYRFGARRWIARILLTWGLHRHGHDVREDSFTVLCNALCTGSRRGGLLPRRRVLHVAMVSG